MHVLPLRVEDLWISPVILSVVQVVLRNGNKAAFLYWYSIDHCVFVACPYHPVLSMCTRVSMRQNSNPYQ